MRIPASSYTIPRHQKPLVLWQFNMNIVIMQHSVVGGVEAHEASSPSLNTMHSSSSTSAASRTLIGGRSAGPLSVTVLKGQALLWAVLALKLAMASLLLSMPNSTCEVAKQADRGACGPQHRKLKEAAARAAEKPPQWLLL
jgi:hypothetical protein